MSTRPSADAGSRPAIEARNRRAKPGTRSRAPSETRSGGGAAPPSSSPPGRGIRANPNRLRSDAPGLAGGRLRRLELALDQIEPQVPEPRVGEVDPDDRAELLRAARAARGEQLEVGGDERRALLAVAAV